VRLPGSHVRMNGRCSVIRWNPESPMILFDGRCPENRDIFLNPTYANEGPNRSSQSRSRDHAQAGGDAGTER
jgi:hypothetical protein